MKKIIKKFLYPVFFYSLKIKKITFYIFYTLYSVRTWAGSFLIPKRYGGDSLTFTPKGYGGGPYPVPCTPSAPLLTPYPFGVWGTPYFVPCTLYPVPCTLYSVQKKRYPVPLYLLREAFIFIKQSPLPGPEAPCTLSG